MKNIFDLSALAAVDRVVQVIPSKWSELPPGVPEVLRHFIAGPILLDTFTHHDPRRRWAKALCDEWGRDDPRSIWIAENPIKRGRVRSAAQLASAYGVVGLDWPGDACWYDGLDDYAKAAYVNQVRQAIVNGFLRKT